MRRLDPTLYALVMLCVSLFWLGVGVGFLWGRYTTPGNIIVQ